jgi:5-methyltetrahydrofolate--homocysteine methyltransferase
MAALDKKSVLAAVKEGLDARKDPLKLVDEARDGLEAVGEKFDSGEYFLMELMQAAQIFQAAAEILNPAIQEKYGGVSTNGKVLIGTVAGDVHDLGKNIVKILLECRGVEVVDLGVDVPVEVFVEKIREVEPDVVGMSALLTASIPQMKASIEAIDAAGMRESAKVIVGGGIVGEVDLSEVKADHATTNANEGIKVIVDWIKASSKSRSDHG